MSELSAQDKDRVINLTIDLQRTQREKKDTVGSYNDEIKRIKAEIDDILNRRNQAEGQ